MATTYKNLGNADVVTNILKENGILVEVGGSIRRITLENFMKTFNTDQEELLESVAWGIPMKYGVQTSPSWGLVGNTSALASYRAKVGRYAVKSVEAGIVQATKLHPGDSSMKIDGTAVATDGTESVMVIAPRLYYLVRNGDSYPTLWLSEVPISKHYFATTADGLYICAGAYKGSVTGDNKLVSIPGVKFGQSKNINTFWTDAQNFNTGMGVINYNFLRWFQAICLSEAGGNANIQAALGYGPGGSASIAWDTFNASDVLTLTGKTAELGDDTGKVDISTDDGGTTNSCHVSVAGIEDFWNCQWEMVQGIFFGSSANTDGGQTGSEVYLYEGNRMPTTAELASYPKGEYRQITRPTSDGYVKSIVGGEYWDTICSELGGSTSSYFCDRSYNNATGQLCLAGADSNVGAAAGPFCVNSHNAWSNAWTTFGARPAFYGTIRFAA